MNRTMVAQTSWSAVSQASSLQAESKFSRPNASGACRLQVGDTADQRSDQRSALLYPVRSGSWSQFKSRRRGLSRKRQSDFETRRRAGQADCQLARFEPSAKVRPPWF